MNFQPILDSLNKILTDILDFLPRFINGLIIFIIGYFLCVLIRALMRFIFRRTNLERLLERGGVSSAIKSLGVKAPLTEIIASIVFYFLFLSFATSAVRLMGIVAVAELLENILRFVPRAISSAILLVLGTLIARFLGNTIASIMTNIGITYGRAIGRIIEYAVVIFAAVLSISTLGVDTSILTSSLTIVVASVGLAIALTFGLGSREAATNVIAGYYVRQNFQIGQTLTFDNYTGIIRSISSAYTVLETTADDGTVTITAIPNVRLLQNTVQNRETAPKPPVPKDTV
jgi:small-conductance mechanosensitive channel